MIGGVDDALRRGRSPLARRSALMQRLTPLRLSRRRRPARRRRHPQFATSGQYIVALLGMSVAQMCAPGVVYGLGAAHQGVP